MTEEIKQAEQPEENWDTRIVVGDWNFYQTGIDRLDREHQRLFEMVDELQHNPKLIDAVAFLGEYVDRHFAYEEQMMMHYRYDHAEYIRHVEEHNNFFKDFRKIQAQVRSGNTKGLLEDVVSQVIAWLIDHIGVTDRKMADFLKEAGAR